MPQLTRVAARLGWGDVGGRRDVGEQAVRDGSGWGWDWDWAQRLLVGCGYVMLFVALACRVLGLATGLSAVVWCELNGGYALLRVLGMRAMPEEVAGSLGAYLEVGFWWGVAVCVAGIRGAGRPGSARRRSARVAAGNLGLLLSVLWPLQVGVAAAVGLRRPGRHPGRRAVTAVAGVLVLVGGAWWGYAGFTPLRPWTGARSAAALAGRWHGAHGETLVLRRDGTFSATGFPPGVWFRDPKDTEHWTIRGADGSSVLRLDAVRAPTSRESLELDVFGFPRPSRLCPRSGPDDPCDPALRR